MGSDLLCEHPSPPRARKHRAECPTCGSFADLDFAAAPFAYTDDYAKDRAHFDPWVGRCKERTLAHWLKRVRLEVKGLSVCEVGFGGGHCLGLLQARGAEVRGIEATDAAITAARARGIAAERLYKTDALPARLDAAIDLWIFQDSFEHIPDPGGFVEWMLASSARTARVLIVCPRADSMSSALLGKYWPHKLPDHPFHWSLDGLSGFFEKRGFARKRRFFPLKFVSPQTMVLHLYKKLRPNGQLVTPPIPLAVPFNFGEMGVLFERVETSDQSPF